MQTQGKFKDPKQRKGNKSNNKYHITLKKIWDDQLFRQFDVHTHTLDSTTIIAHLLVLPKCAPGVGL